MPQINCKDLTNTQCNFVATGETAKETKDTFYKHGAESDIHKEKYQTATDEEKAAFGKMVDEYLEKQ